MMGFIFKYSVIPWTLNPSRESYSFSFGNDNLLLPIMLNYLFQ